MTTGNESLVIPTVTKLERSVLTNHRSFLKIREFQDGQWEELGKRIDAVSMGIQKEPITRERMILIIDILKKKFSDFGMNEIIEAFTMAFAKEIEVDKTYGNLTVEWIASVLVAYRKYRNKHIALFEKDKEANKPQVEYTDLEYYDGLVKIIKELKEIPETYQYDAVFRHLEDAKLVSLTTDEKQMYADNVKADIQESISIELDRETRNKLKALIDNTAQFKKECRRLYCINHFKNKK